MAAPASWSRPAGYEDWYLVEDFAALGVLDEAAVARGHAPRTTRPPRWPAWEPAAVYRLLEGSAEPGARPDGGLGRAGRAATSGPRSRELLGDGMDPERDGLWRRCLVLGPAPEYCLLAGEPPAGVAPSRLPQGWTATTLAREVLWGG